MKKRFAFTIIAILVLCFVVSKLFFQFVLIRGESMSPTYRNLQLVILDKTAETYERGDVVAARVMVDGKETLVVKRIVGREGDSVLISDGVLYVNGELSKSYGEELFEYAGWLSEERSLGKGEFILIGDNISESNDSRNPEIKAVQGDAIEGRILGSKPRRK